MLISIKMEKNKQVRDLLQCLTRPEKREKKIIRHILTTLTHDYTHRHGKAFAKQTQQKIEGTKIGLNGHMRKNQGPIQISKLDFVSRTHMHLLMQ